MKTQRIVRLLTLTLIFQLVACGEGEPWQQGPTYTTDNVPTSDIKLSINARVLHDNTSVLSVHVYGYKDNATRSLRLSAEDKLYLELDGVWTEISEIYVPANLQVPEGLYYYEIQLNANIAASTVNVVFDRVNFTNAVNPIQFGDAPEIITPLVNTVFNSASDDVVVNWRPSNVPVDELVVREDPCGRSMTFFGQDAAITSVIFPASTNFPRPCLDQGVSVMVINIWYLTPSPELDPQTSIYASIRRSVDIIYEP